MRDKIASVGGLTLLSRIVGFVRDIQLAAILGAGPMADAFLVAQRLPNHFRAIFAEGAFNTAYVPSYNHVRETAGPDEAQTFADRIYTLMLLVQAVLLLLALLATPAVLHVLAPGFAADPEKFALAVDLTRITFPYLLFIALMTVLTGTLNALGRFTAGAFAPVLMNLCLIAGLAAWRWFPSAGHAAAWGVFAAGVAQFALLWLAARRAGVMARLRWPRLDAPARRFWKAFGPATIGSMGVQLSLFADTLIASFLPAGAIAALYYADRINQLPIGVIGIAAGTVLLPTMSKWIAQGDEAAARQAQNRAMEFTLFLAIPCIVAFFLIPDLIMQALFGRGRFDAAAAHAAARTLQAYTLGLAAFVLIRSVVASFHARGDTTTPLKASLTAIAVNIALKILLMQPLAQVGLALATSAGAWLNLLLVGWLAWRRGFLVLDRRLLRSLGGSALAGGLLALALWLAPGPAARLCATLPRLQTEATLLLVVLLGAVAYFGVSLSYNKIWRQ